MHHHGYCHLLIGTCRFGVCVCGTEYRERVTVSSVVVDVCDVSGVKDALRGVDAVIHTAGIISVSTYPEDGAMYRTNVKGMIVTHSALFITSIIN